MNKNIVLCVVLSIVTCGIYGLYWMYTLNESARTVNPNEWQMEGVLAVVLTIVTCGIFGYYWNYKMGKAFTAIGAPDNSVLYLVLSIIGLSIVNWCIMQDSINRAYPTQQ